MSEVRWIDGERSGHWWAIWWPTDTVLAPVSPAERFGHPPPTSSGTGTGGPHPARHAFRASVGGWGRARRGPPGPEHELRQAPVNRGGRPSETIAHNATVSAPTVAEQVGHIGPRPSAEEAGGSRQRRDSRGGRRALEAGKEATQSPVLKRMKEAERKEAPHRSVEPLP